MLRFIVSLAWFIGMVIGGTFVVWLVSWVIYEILLQKNPGRDGGRICASVGLAVVLAIIISRLVVFHLLYARFHLDRIYLIGGPITLWLRFRFRPKLKEMAEPDTASLRKWASDPDPEKRESFREWATIHDPQALKYLGEEELRKWASDPDPEERKGFRNWATHYAPETLKYLEEDSDV